MVFSEQDYFWNIVGLSHWFLCAKIYNKNPGSNYYTCDSKFTPNTIYFVWVHLGVSCNYFSSAFDFSLRNNVWTIISISTLGNKRREEKMKQKAFFLLCIMLLVLLLGCGKQQQTQTNSEQVVDSGITSVVIQDFAFSSGTTTVPLGSTITWTNEDTAPHTVTGTNFDSGTLNNKQQWSYTFTEPGTYEYHCSFHTSMKGTVIVE